LREKIALCLVLVGAMAPGPAGAADDAVCQEFTFTMLAYVKTNALKHCTGMGPQWSTRPAEHLSWCKAATDAAVKARLAESRAFIDQCMKTGIGGPAPPSAPAPAKPAPGGAAPPRPGAALPAETRASAAEASLPKVTYP